MNNKFKNNKGITLVALVVTIVVLLILAGVSINLVVGENGIINKAKDAKKNYEDEAKKENQELQDTDAWIDEQLGILKPVDEGVFVEGKNKKFTDSNGNIAVIPVGFKVLTGYSDISKGLVIEDESQNQYVWIPVGSVKKSPTETVDIKIGRYTFDTSKGTPTLVQPASDFKDETKVINSYYKELPSDTATAHKNTISKDLAGFITSAKTNGGYYIGRYEDSYASGSSVEDYKLQSQVSTATDDSESMSYSKGTLWNNITQPDAAKVCKNMYTDKVKYGVESDLMNSYAWDTAIDYIQKMGNSNYANANRLTTGNSTLKNTGETGDVKCNIYDMAANVSEWTTETHSDDSYPCSYRGGYYYLSSIYTSSRFNGCATGGNITIGFRPVLYIK